MARIVLTTPEGQVLEFELTAERMSVGRNDDNDIAVPDGSVSGSHGQFAFDGSTWTFSDLGSTNGTKVGGDRVENVELGNGAKFEIGNVAATFYDDSAAEAAPSYSAPAAHTAPRTSTASAGGYGAAKIERAARTGFGPKKVKADGTRTMLMLLGVVGLAAVIGIAAMIATGGLSS